MLRMPERGGDTISFNIPGAGVHTINLTFDLGSINKSVTIDGTTQPGFAGVPLIELNGANSIIKNTSGLILAASSCTVKGLIINRFGSAGIRILASNGNTISGNYIGTNAAGTAAAANGTNGIEIVDNGFSGSTNNVIGGTAAGAGNLISGNAQNGLVITGNASTGNVVQGNFFGTNAAGTGAIANGTANPGSVDAVIVGGSNNTIGGTTAAARNVISGNANNGLEMNGTNNTAQGNFIGTDLTGNNALANFRDGIIVGGTNNLIGGTTVAARNIVSGNASGIGIDVCCGGRRYR